MLQDFSIGLESWKNAEPSIIVLTFHGLADLTMHLFCAIHVLFHNVGLQMKQDFLMPTGFLALPLTEKAFQPTTNPVKFSLHFKKKKKKLFLLPKIVPVALHFMFFALMLPKSKIIFKWTKEKNNLNQETMDEDHVLCKEEKFNSVVLFIINEAFLSFFLCWGFQVFLCWGYQVFETAGVITPAVSKTWKKCAVHAVLRCMMYVVFK